MQKINGISASFQGKMEIRTYQKIEGKIVEKTKKLLTRPSQDEVIKNVVGSMVEDKETFAILNPKQTKAINSLLEFITGKKLEPMPSGEKRFVIKNVDNIQYGDRNPEETGGIYLKLNLNPKSKKTTYY